MTVTVIDPTPALVVIDLQKAVLAMPAVHPLEHQNSVERIFPRIGETTTTAEFLATLELRRP